MVKLSHRTNIQTTSTAKMKKRKIMAVKIVMTTQKTLMIRLKMMTRMMMMMMTMMKMMMRTMKI